MKTVTYSAPAIHCGGCVASIQRSLRSLTGVEEATANLGTKLIEVRYDESATDESAIAARLEAAGYPATKKQ